MRFKQLYYSPIVFVFLFHLKIIGKDILALYDYRNYRGVFTPFKIFVEILICFWVVIA